MELSVVIPVLNEAAALPGLLAGLARQAGVAFEVLLVDGGSADRTAEIAEELAPGLPYPLRVLRTPRGRAGQLNRGANAATGTLLLFLHADSMFADADALARGVALVAPAPAGRPAAARYALQFRHAAGASSAFGYYFHTAKARLDRPGCTHGDQGLLVNRAAFAAAGPFPVDLPLAEDTRFADRVRQVCGWQLIPAELATSARRFEQEGLRERQTLNALLLNFVAIGWDDFFRAAPAVYAAQGENDRLDLRPWWQLIDDRLMALSRLQRWRLLWQTGRYVRGNAWQLAFYVDARRNFRRHLPAGAGSTPCLDTFDRLLAPLLRNPLATAAAALLTRTWFILSGWRLQRGRTAAR